MYTEHRSHCACVACACVCAHELPRGACIFNRCSPPLRHLECTQYIHACILGHFVLFDSCVTIFIWIIISSKQHNNENTLYSAILGCSFGIHLKSEDGRFKTALCPQAGAGLVVSPLAASLTCSVCVSRNAEFGVGELFLWSRKPPRCTFFWELAAANWELFRAATVLQAFFAIFGVKLNLICYQRIIWDLQQLNADQSVFLKIQTTRHSGAVRP